MHKTHGCYAISSLIFSARSAYLRAIARTRTDHHDKDKTMNFVRSFSEWRRYRATCTELNKLTARELNDLGINRGDIPFVARKVTRA
jgi:uncharacterized protein YjiS (DUF1127 family)